MLNRAAITPAKDGMKSRSLTVPMSLPSDCCEIKIEIKD